MTIVRNVTLTCPGPGFGFGEAFFAGITASHTTTFQPDPNPNNNSLQTDPTMDVFCEGDPPTPTPTATATPTRTPTPNGAETDVPNADKANVGAWVNDALSTCGSGSLSTTCSARIDEDIDGPDDLDYLQSPSNPSGAIVEFELTDAPADLQQLAELNLRFRASKSGSRSATVQIQILKSDGTNLGGPSQLLTTTPTSYSSTITGLSLTAADVDGLFLRVTGSTSGGGSPTTVRVQTINVEKAYFAVPTPTPTATATATPCAPEGCPTPTPTATPTPSPCPPPTPFPTTTPTATPTAVGAPTATPGPTRVPPPPVTIIICNDTGQTMTDLHVRTATFYGNADVLQANAPGCPAPAKYAEDGFDQTNEFLDLVWPTACVDPLERVTVKFQCLESCAQFPPHIHCYTWTRFGLQSGRPCGFPPRSPYRSFFNGNTQAANDLHFRVSNFGLPIQVLLGNAPGCANPSITTTGSDPVLVDVVWPAACVDTNEIVSVALFSSSCTDLLVICASPVVDCFNFTLDGAPLDSPDPCPALPPTATPTPSPTPTATPTATATPIPIDSDGDGWSDGAEGTIGTNPLAACGVNAWPADFNNDASVTGADLSAVAGVIGQSVPTAPQRRDIAPDPPDGAVTGADLSAVAGRIGTSCSPT